MFITTPMLTVVFLAFAQPAETSGLTVVSNVSEKWYAVQCTEEMVSRTPRWNEDAESPPLSPREAIKLAKKAKDSFFKNNGFSPSSLTLMRINERWVWEVTFKGPPKKRMPPEAQRAPDWISLIALMDGTVPKPSETDGFSGTYEVAAQPDDDEQRDPKESPNSK